MRILIAADMEGISGVVNWDQVTPGHGEYARFRRLMTGDVNAAVRGAFEAGADEVAVTDGHGYGNNILIEELDPRARLNAGNDSPFAMVEGVDTKIQGALFVGYHARAGSENGILDHTWSSSAVANLWLNDILVGETGLNAALCGHFDVPVIMVSGDHTVCAEAMDLLGSIELAAVKHATSRFSAECMPPQVAQDKICEAAARAVARLGAGQAVPPFRLPVPIQVAVEFFNSNMADNASFLPGAYRVNGRRIEFQAADMTAAYSGFRAAVTLATG